MDTADDTACRRHGGVRRYSGRQVDRAGSNGARSQEMVYRKPCARQKNHSNMEASTASVTFNDKIFDTGCLPDSGRVQSWEQYGVKILEIF